MLEHFHNDLAIPNDAPLWFDSTTQTAQLLVFLRCFCLFLLMLIAAGISGQITCAKFSSFLKITAGILVPTVIFLFVGEFMNFFLISVRLGTPFNYLPPLKLQFINFSFVKCLQFVAFSLLCAIPLSKSGKVLFADIFSATGIMLFCAPGFCVCHTLLLYF